MGRTCVAVRPPVLDLLRWPLSSWGRIVPNRGEQGPFFSSQGDDFGPAAWSGRRTTWPRWKAPPGHPPPRRRPPSWNPRRKPLSPPGPMPPWPSPVRANAVGDRPPRRNFQQEAPPRFCAFPCVLEQDVSSLAVSSIMPLKARHNWPDYLLRGLVGRPVNVSLRCSRAPAPGEAGPQRPAPVEPSRKRFSHSEPATARRRSHGIHYPRSRRMARPPNDHGSFRAASW